MSIMDILLPELQLRNPAYLPYIQKLFADNQQEIEQLAAPSYASIPEAPERYFDMSKAAWVVADQIEQSTHIKIAA